MDMANSKSDNTRQWAKSMYIYENRTQQEIADATGVSRQTIIRWAKADKWDELKVSMTMTREEQIKSLQRQLSEINKTISERKAEDGHAMPTPRRRTSSASLQMPSTNLKTTSESMTASVWPTDS